MRMLRSRGKSRLKILRQVKTGEHDQKRNKFDPCAYAYICAYVTGENQA